MDHNHQWTTSGFWTWCKKCVLDTLKRLEAVVAQIKNLFVAKKQSFFDARLQRFPTVRYVKKAEKAKNVFAIDSPQCYFHSKPVIVAKQGHGDMAVSSSIGSNIFDMERKKTF